MRKVKFKKYVTSTWKNIETGETKLHFCNPGLEDKSSKWSYVKAGYFETDFLNDGIFHSWGFESQDNGEQVIMDSIAIIELPDGSVEMIRPDRIKFVN